MTENNNPLSAAYWENLLKQEGMPANLSEDIRGVRVQLGDGLGRNSLHEEWLEDQGGHSSLCPLKLGRPICTTKLNQPSDRPVDDDLF